MLLKKTRVPTVVGVTCRLFTLMALKVLDVLIFVISHGSVLRCMKHIIALLAMFATLTMAHVLRAQLLVRVLVTLLIANSIALRHPTHTFATPLLMSAKNARLVILVVLTRPKHVLTATNPLANSSVCEMPLLALASAHIAALLTPTAPTLSQLALIAL